MLRVTAEILVLAVIAGGAASGCGGVKTMSCKAATGTMSMVGANTSEMPDEETAHPTLVARGDTFEVTQDAISNAPTVPITFSQNCEDKTVKYVRIDGAKPASKPAFTLFIEEGQVEAFKAKSKASGGVIQAEIDGDYQYGQDADKTMRWVVFHNKAHKPFQSRFFTTDMRSMANDAVSNVAGTAKDSGATRVIAYGDTAADATQEGSKVAADAVGHYLRTFNK